MAYSLRFSWWAASPGGPAIGCLELQLLFICDWCALLAPSKPLQESANSENWSLSIILKCKMWRSLIRCELLSSRHNIAILHVSFFSRPLDFLKMSFHLFFSSFYECCSKSFKILFLIYSKFLIDSNNEDSKTSPAKPLLRNRVVMTIISSDIN